MAEHVSKLPHSKIRMTAALLTLCVAAVGGCSSALDTSPNERAWNNYSEELIARQVLRGGSVEIPTQDPTVNAGITEMARVERVQPDGTRVSGLVPLNTAPIMTAAVEPSNEPAMTTTHPENYGLAEPVRAVTLEDAIARAMQHSLAIKVEAYNPAIKETLITQATGAFDPVLFANTNWTNTNEPSLQAFTSLNGKTWLNQAGVRQLLPSGGTVQATFGDTYHDFVNGSAFTVNSSHQIATGLQLTQPLLKGFGDDVTRANIYLAQRDKRIALSAFRRQVIDTVSKVEDAYHTLWQSQEVLVIQEDLLQKTWESYDKNMKRIGDVTVITAKQAQAAYEQRQAELVRARAAVRNASDNLKALINDPDLDIKGNQLIVASDRGIEVPIVFSINEQMDTALRQRGELQEARLQIERADIVINAARNDLLPKVDLTASATANGLESGFDKAFGNTVSPDAANIDWVAGLKIEVPLGNNTALATLRKNQLERRQAIVQMLNIVQQIVLDVKLRMREVMTSYQELSLRKRAEESAGTALNAITASEESRNNLGPEFLQLKLDAQQRLANARLDKLQAIVNYNVALMRLEQAKGTLLEYNHIAIGPAPRPSDSGKGRFLDHTFDMNSPTLQPATTPSGQ